MYTMKEAKIQPCRIGMAEVASRDGVHMNTKMYMLCIRIEYRGVVRHGNIISEKSSVDIKGGR